MALMIENHKLLEFIDGLIDDVSETISDVIGEPFILAAAHKKSIVDKNLLKLFN